MLHGLRVLAVDAATDSADLYGTFLRTRRADVRVASDGKGALARVHPTWVPHALVTDLRLPDMDGFELARRVTERSATPVALIGITSDARGPALSRARAAGFSVCLVKPIELAKLFAAIAEGVERSRGSSPLPARWS
jgi:CheY-like chemotaxis protein